MGHDKLWVAAFRAPSSVHVLVVVTDEFNVAKHLLGKSAGQVVSWISVRDAQLNTQHRLGSVSVFMLVLYPAVQYKLGQRLRGLQPQSRNL